MPVWHEATKELRKSGKLVVVGITQEQHPDRCRLFAQWHGIDWPILWDPFNITQSKVVPRFILLDEASMVRSLRAKPSDLAAFLEQPPPKAAVSPPPPRVNRLRPWDAWDEVIEWSEFELRAVDVLSDALWKRKIGDPGVLDAFFNLGPEWRFRKGVLLRMREDSKARMPGDFQASIDTWRAALAENPRQYIWRRRIQQYGPRLDKPYPFYNWMKEARAAIKARGETPIATPVALTLAESLSPREKERTADKQPDAEGKLVDAGKHFRIHTVVVAHTDGRKQTARVHARLHVDAGADATIDLESGRPMIWIAGLGYAARAPATGAHITFEFDVPMPKDASAPTKGYATFWICSKKDGTCKFVRLDVEVPIGAK